MIKDAFFCSCGSNEHFFVLQRFHDEENVYLSIYLSRLKFHKRVLNAIKYIFGYRSIYGHFSEICLDQVSQLHLAAVLEHHIKTSKNVPI
jgi:hypothetical protein